jgi:hypothetical protein
VVPRLVTLVEADFAVNAIVKSRECLQSVCFHQKKIIKSVHRYEEVVKRYDYQFKEEALPLELGRSSGLSSLMSRNTGGNV